MEKARHSLSHLLAAAVLEIYPEAKLGIGPAIENGFYYDIDFGVEQIKDSDLNKIEKKMRQLAPAWSDFRKELVTPEEARSTYKDNPYKLELIEEIIKKGEEITFYTSGPDDKKFVDLCQGGHIEDFKQIDLDGFKLERLAGAYWRGNEKNKMLTRIYGLAFVNQTELEDFLKQKEEGEKRDHRKLGKELDLFTFSDLVGAGLPMFTPRGTIIRNQLGNKLLKISQKYGMELVTIPHIAKKKLYETSGHADKFGDELIKVVSHYDEFVMKPVNCPHHTQIYASKPRSYRDLPVRYMESTMQYRDEKPGEIGGLTRVRAITVDDGHIFCTVDQIKQEAKNIAQIIEEFYTDIGLFGNHWVSLSVRDPQNPDGYIGEEADWNKAESMLAEVSDELGLEAKRVEGEAAIYGPKLDYMFKDSLGRQWQLATIQIDFAMPKRFNLEYTNEQGIKVPPVMIHRAILGSYERFMAILIEHFAGSFPVWLSPVQVAIIPVGEKHREQAEIIKNILKQENIRVEIKNSDDTLGKKIRQVKTEKTPYWLVIGDKEIAEGKYNLEGRDGDNQNNLEQEDIIGYLKSK